MLLSSYSKKPQAPHHHLCHHPSNLLQRQRHCHRHNTLCQRRNYGLSWIALPLLLLLLTFSQCPPCSSFVVPNEVPSILSVVYSNIPPIKKGTDSRLGFGFRLGEHADFQVLVELGPQKDTQPIGDQDNSDGSSFNKRQVNKTQQRAVQREVAKTERQPNTWLEKWSNQANPGAATKKKVTANKIKPTKKSLTPKQLPQYPMHQMPPQAIQQLQMLYKMATSTTTEESLANSKENMKTTSSSSSFDSSKHLQERLRLLKAPVAVEQLQTLMQNPPEKTKAEITKELMDVNLDE